MTKMKLMFVMAVMVGIYMVPLTATALSCDRVWGDPATYDQKIVAVKRALQIQEGDTTVPRVSLGRLLVAYNLKNCKDRFNLLSEAKQSPMGYVHFAMGKSDLLPAGEWYADMEVAHVERLVREGLNLGLPPVRHARVEQLHQAVTAVQQGEELTSEEVANFGNSLEAVQAELKKSGVGTAEAVKLAKATEEALQAFQTENSLKVEHLTNLQVALKGELKLLRAAQRRQELQVATNSENISSLQSAGMIRDEKLKGLDVRVTRNSEDLATLGDKFNIVEQRFTQFTTEVNEKVAGLGGRIDGYDKSINELTSLVNSRSYTLGFVMLLLVGLALVISGLLQRSKNQLVQEQVDRTSKKAADQDKKLDDLTKVVHGLQSDVAAIHSLATEASELSQHVGEAGARNVVLAEDNPPANGLLLGKDNGVEWQCQYLDNNYVIKIWRDETMSAGQVQTDAFGPIMVKDLGLKFATGVVSGRVPPTGPAKLTSVSK